MQGKLSPKLWQTTSFICHSLHIEIASPEFPTIISLIETDRKSLKQRNAGITKRKICHTHEYGTFIISSSKTHKSNLM